MKKSPSGSINVGVTVTREVATALGPLRDTGLYGNGIDISSVAGELLRWAVREVTRQLGGEVSHFAMYQIRSERHPDKRSDEA